MKAKEKTQKLIKTKVTDFKEVKEMQERKKRKSIKQVFKDYQLRTSRWRFSDGIGEYLDKESAFKRARVLNREGIDAKIEQADTPSFTKSLKRVEYFVLERASEGEKPILLLLEREKPREKGSATNKPQMTLINVKNLSGSSRRVGLGQSKAPRITPKTPRLRR